MNRATPISNQHLLKMSHSFSAESGFIDIAILMSLDYDMYIHLY